MESLFYSRTVYDENGLYHGHLLTISKVTNIYIKVGVGLLLLSLVHGVITTGFNLSFLPMPLVCIFLILELFVFRKLRAKTVYKRQVQMYGGATIMEIHYFEDHFLFHDSISGTKGRVEYIEIGRAHV